MVSLLYWKKSQIIWWLKEINIHYVKDYSFISNKKDFGFDGIFFLLLCKLVITQGR